MTAHPPLEQRRAAELMTRDLLTIAASESVLMAWELMCKAGVHHLPVTDDEGGFVGVVDAQTITATWSAAAPQEARRPVTSLLPSRPPPAVGPSSTVREAARAMLESGGDHVAVTDEHGVLVGLITARDLIGALAGAERDKAPRSGGMPSLYRIEPVLPRTIPAHAARTEPPPG
ncbi:CBS domain protein [Actinomadura hallensis]|uniref:CBS domain protein n=1 Tax=Actinomadura hallensis TaxID=337895 RepID=A0A543IG95_9ACTN|nr:CBS domain-containing protein [Actinomadura hallensis]TQM69611.1 CBS domain protein [Actinomadura hallensis]